MKTHFNEAREIETERDPFIQEILNMHAMINRYDPADLFIKFGRLLGFRRYTTIQRTDFSHFLLNSEWIRSGIFTADPGGTAEASYSGESRQGLSGSTFFLHSLWTTAGVFGLQM